MGDVQQRLVSGGSWGLVAVYRIPTDNLATCTFIPGPSGAHLCLTSLVKDKRDIPEQVSAI